MSSTRTKSDLAHYLSERIGLNGREAKELVECFFAQIQQALVRCESVKLAGFGRFDVSDKAPRPGRNPKTGQACRIDARRVVTFYASRQLKQRVAHHVTQQVIYDD